LNIEHAVFIHLALGIESSKVLNHSVFAVFLLNQK